MNQETRINTCLSLASDIVRRAASWKLYNYNLLRHSFSQRSAFSESGSPVKTFASQLRSMGGETQNHVLSILIEVVSESVLQCK